MSISLTAPIVTTNEAAHRLGISRAAVLHAIRDGRLPATRCCARSRAAWEISEADLAAYEEHRGRNGRLLTASEVARRTGLSRERIGQLYRNGTITPERRERAHILFPATVVAQIKARPVIARVVA